MRNEVKIIELIDQLISRFEIMVPIYKIDKSLADWFLYDLKELKKMEEELK